MLQRSAAGGQPEQAELDEADQRLTSEEEPGDHSHDREAQTRHAGQTKEGEEREEHSHGGRVEQHLEEVEGQRRAAHHSGQSGADVTPHALGQEGKGKGKAEAGKSGSPPGCGDRTEQGSDQEEDGGADEANFEIAKVHD